VKRCNRQKLWRRDQHDFEVLTRREPLPVSALIPVVKKKSPETGIGASGVQVLGQFSNTTLIAPCGNQMTLRENFRGYNLSQSMDVNLRRGCIVATGRPTFNCPNCSALYQVVRQEAGPETVDRETTCRSCGGPLPGREGKFVLKYFLLRKAGRIQKWKRA
jgi:hypothetical protein